MSKIIKAAQLKVLVTSSEDTIYRSEASGETKKSLKSEGTILEASKIIDEAKLEAGNIVAEAEAKAREIIKEANLARSKIEQELDQVVKNAHQEGFSQGYEQGVESGKADVSAKFEEMMETFQGIIDSALVKRARALSLLEDDFLKLSLYIAEKIIRREISLDPAWLLPTISDGLDRLAEHDSISIRVNPQVYSVLIENNDFAEVLNGRIKWESDPVLGVNDCLIETEFGAIDASLDTRLARLKTVLEEQLYVK